MSPIDRTFADRYQVTSIKGRIYTRSMLLSAVMRDPMRKLLGLTRADVADVIDDDTWMRFHKGEIPARVTEEAVTEAHTRKLTRS